MNASNRSYGALRIVRLLFPFKPSLHQASTHSRNHRLFARGEQGSALVEMALVMPVMLMMLTGIFSFSVVLYQKLQLGEAVSNAGRVMALERGDTDPCATTASAIYAAAPALAKANLTLTFTLGGTNTSGTVTGGTRLRRDEGCCSYMHGRRQRRGRGIGSGLARADSGDVSVLLHYL